VSGIASGDRLEPEALEPAKSLVDWRKEQDEARYRQSCEDAYGMVELGSEIIHPADILDALRADAARRGRDDASTSFRTELEEKVCERFPSPIAVPFNAFLHGSLDPLKRLLHLRDSWEGLIHLLSALALSECASTGSPINGFKVRTSEASAAVPCKLKDLRTDSLALRIGLMEAVLVRCSELSIELELSKLIPAGLLSEIRRLNTIRNGFSHEGAKSESQATLLIEEAYPLFREVLVDLSELGEIELFRLRQIKPGTPPVAEVELLTGHAQSKRVRPLSLEGATGAIALGAAPVDGIDRVLAKLGPKIIDLSPYFYAFDDSTGHRTRVAFFKSKKDGKWNLEVVGESVAVIRDEGPHEAQMARFYELLDGGEN